MSTPPPQLQQEPPTPEQVRKRELNRLKAKERQRQWLSKQAESQQTASTSNVNGKRPMVWTPAGPPRVERDGAKAVSQQAQAPKPLPRDTRLIGKYIEYDLSKMVNRKGGFLLEDGQEVDEEVRRKERQREHERMRQNVEPPVLLGASDTQPICCECASIHIDSTFQRVFGCLVCNKCKDEKPEKYSLLTKTECKEDYLLTDPELRDHELLPHLLKANPHSSTWNNMMLFLRFQVEEYAFKVKWGSSEALDAEFGKRVAYKKVARQKKFDKSLQELRKRTKESIWQQRRDEEHVHEYGVIEKTGAGGEGVQRCMSCGFEVEVEEM